MPILFYLPFALFVRSSPAKVGLKAYQEETPGLCENESRMKEELKKHGKLYPYRYLLSDLSFDRILIMHISVGIARYGLLTWVPMYFIERFGVNIMESLLSSLALPVGMGIGSFVVPLITDKMKNRMTVVPFIGIGAAVAIIGFLFLDPRTTWGGLLIQVLLFIAGFLVYAIGGVLNTVACDIGGRVMSGTSNGLFGFTGYFGAGIQSVIYGAIVKNVGWNMVFISIGIFLLICSGLALIGKKKS